MPPPDYRRECGQCSFVKADGHRCRLRTCMRFPYCWVHLKSQEGLVVKPSTIANAGLGLFFVGSRLRPELRKSDIVTYYSAPEKLTKVEYDKRYDPYDSPPAYGLCINRNACFDSGSTANHPGRLINTSNATKINARFVQSYRRVDNRWMVPIRATKNIAPGSEVFISYGNEYRL